MPIEYESKTALCEREIKWKSRYQAKARRKERREAFSKKMAECGSIVWAILKPVLIALACIVGIAVALLLLNAILYVGVGVVAVLFVIYFLQ